ncbi:MAG: c-type cytochrome [Sandarakinorhabdus sp.]
MRALPVAALLAAVFTAACGGADKPAEAPKTTTPAESAMNEAPAEPVPAEVTPGDTPAGDTPAVQAAPAAVSYSSLTGDAAQGEVVFAQCKACHVVDAGKNRVGPSLWAVVGRTAGTVPGFTYSKANKDSGVAWTEDVLYKYLEAPQKFMPGTKMAFGGLKKPQDRADVIAYLKTKA